MPEGQQAEDAFVGVGATRGALRGHHIYIPYAAFSVLLIDEGLPDHPDEGMRSILLELLEHRYDTASTVFSTKSREEGLASKARIRDDADAIMDRIVHNTICVDTGTHNMLEHATMSQQRNSPAGVDGPHHDDRWPPTARSGGLPPYEYSCTLRSPSWRSATKKNMRVGRGQILSRVGCALKGSVKELTSVVRVQFLNELRKATSMLR